MDGSFTKKAKCHICNFEYSYEFSYDDSLLKISIISSSNEVGKATAVDSNATEYGNNVDFEVLVCCPRCKNQNKYKVTKHISTLDSYYA